MAGPFSTNWHDHALVTCHIPEYPTPDWAITLYPTVAGGLWSGAVLDRGDVPHFLTPGCAQWLDVMPLLWLIGAEQWAASSDNPNDQNANQTSGRTGAQHYLIKEIKSHRGR